MAARPTLRPMLADAGDLPRDHGPRDDGPAGPWAFEMKWDGVRAVLTVEPGHVGITSRLGNDVTARYPELQGLAAALAPVRAVLDGEIVALDESSRPSFALLQTRMHAEPRNVPALAASTPVVVMLFDVLALDDHETISLTWRERRSLLERLDLAGPHWQTPPVWAPGRGAGAQALATATALGLEGVVAKRVDARYTPGRRSPAWRKVKLTHRQELVVGGWLPGKGRLADTVGSLLVGYHDGPGGPLRPAGRVGSGLDDRTRDALATSLRRRATSPFDPVPGGIPRDARWVEPDTVVEVRFTMWTADGVLRNPVYVGRRDDKDPADVVRERTY